MSFTEEEVASGQVDYNYTMQPFGSTEAPGISVFRKDADGNVFHTYSVYGRGVELMMGTYRILDLMPKGRDEENWNTPWSGCGIMTATTPMRNAAAKSEEAKA